MVAWVFWGFTVCRWVIWGLGGPLTAVYRSFGLLGVRVVGYGFRVSMG